MRFESSAVTPTSEDSSKPASGLPSGAPRPADVPGAARRLFHSGRPCQDDTQNVAKRRWPGPQGTKEPALGATCP